MFKMFKISRFQDQQQCSGFSVQMTSADSDSLVRVRVRARVRVQMTSADSLVREGPSPQRSLLSPTESYQLKPKTSP